MPLRLETKQKRIDDAKKRILILDEKVSAARERLKEVSHEMSYAIVHAAKQYEYPHLEECDRLEIRKKDIQIQLLKQKISEHNQN